MALHISNAIITFADDTTVVGLITNNAYREEVRDLAMWCQYWWEKNTIVLLE